MSAHTPGPWAMTQNPVDVSIHSDRRLIAGVRLGKGTRAGEDAANARLIAAAPDIFHALELFVSAVSTNGEFHALSHELEVGRKALGAARGEEVQS